MNDRTAGRRTAPTSKRIVRSNSRPHATGSGLTRLSHPSSSASSSSSALSTQLWSAVALQQHMLRNVQGLPSNPLRPSVQPRPGKLTLAEKMGLVEAPPPPPTDSEWEVAVNKSKHRHDCGSMCSICQVQFVSSSTEGQVILSCSHVFHETCIKQFEKFARRVGATPMCPLCRAPRYHKRVHYEGKAQVQHHAAAKIQALVRGVLQRRKYLKLRLKSNPQFRVDYAYLQLHQISDMYVARAAAREKEVDTFLEELDLTRQKAVADMMSDNDWHQIRAKILDRHDSLECPICMGTVDHGTEGMASTNSSTQRNQPYMLSCSHCFHGPCLDSFESFQLAAVKQSSNALQAIPRCPVCRAGYAKRSLLDS